MASGLVVVSADAGNTRELIGADRGLIVAVEQSDAIATALRALDHDRARHDAIRASAQTWARERTWEQVWNGLFTEYQSVISGRASSS